MKALTSEALRSSGPLSTVDITVFYLETEQNTILLKTNFVFINSFVLFSYVQHKVFADLAFTLTKGSFLLFVLTS